MGKRIKTVTYHHEDGKIIKSQKEDYIRGNAEIMMGHAGFYALAIGVCCLIMFAG